MVPVENLLAPNQAPAEMPGFGLVPAGLADEIIGRTGGRRWWRRLFTAPACDSDGRILVGGDPRARRLTRLAGETDHPARPDAAACLFRTAPIRHVDHIIPARDGGATSLDNGCGKCEHHNYLREMPGYRVQRVSESGERHTTITITPTGHHYLRRAPNR